MKVTTGRDKASTPLVKDMAFPCGPGLKNRSTGFHPIAETMFTDLQYLTLVLTAHLNTAYPAAAIKENPDSPKSAFLFRGLRTGTTTSQVVR